MSGGFNHFDEAGNAVMVDVTDKDNTERIATARGRIRVNREVFEAVKGKNAAKGDVLGGRNHGGQADQRSDSHVPSFDVDKGLGGFFHG